MKKNSRLVIATSYIVSLVIVDLSFELGASHCLRAEYGSCSASSVFYGLLFSGFLALWLWYFVYVFFNWIYNNGKENERNHIKKKIRNSVSLDEGIKKTIIASIDSNEEI